MDDSAAGILSDKQRTVAPRIFWVVLYDFAFLNNGYGIESQVGVIPGRSSQSRVS